MKKITLNSTFSIHPKNSKLLFILSFGGVIRTFHIKNSSMQHPFQDKQLIISILFYFLQLLGEKILIRKIKIKVQLLAPLIIG